MNQTFSLPHADVLAEDVHESHFTLVARPDEIEPIEVDGASGWTSPNVHPVLSLMRWTTIDPVIARDALDNVLTKFRDQSRGFDWMTGPKTAHLTPLLQKTGFLNPPLSVAAMAIGLSETIELPKLDGIEIHKIDVPSDPRISNVMSKGFDVPDEVGAIYHNAYVTPSDLQKTDVYIATETGNDAPVAVGYLSYIGNGPSVLLRVSSTLESHRGRGLYQAMVLHRLKDAASAGRSRAFVQAYSPSSKHALGSLGFVQAGVLTLHRWRS